jgi:hypothetical protein
MSYNIHEFLPLMPDTSFRLQNCQFKPQISINPYIRALKK